MKAKKETSLFLALIFVLNAASIQKVESKPDDTIFVNPSSIVDLNKTPGSNVTVTIDIDYVEGLHSWQVSLRFNPVLLYTNGSLITEGDFLRSSGANTYFPPPYIGSDYVSIGCLITTQAWVDGGGTLVTITFKVNGKGETCLDLYDTLLGDVDYPNSPPKPHTSQDGYFRNVEQGLTPVTSFSYSPTFPLWKEIVTFDARSSIDPAGISRYLWFFGDINPATNVENTANETNPITYHQYFQTTNELEKNFSVRLLVIDNTGITGNLSVRVLRVFSSRVLQDLAIVNISVNPTCVEPGKSLSIRVSVENQGNSSATFNATVYYDWIPIETQVDITLNASYTRVLDFTWNTTGVAAGSYTVEAFVWPLVNETDLGDNIHFSGPVVISYPPHASFTYEPASPHVDEAIVFNASASYDIDGRITSYSWDFGEWIFNEGNVTTVTTPFIIHSYAASVTCIVKLTVTDNLGAKNSTSQWVTISKIPTVLSLTMSPTATVGSSLPISGSISPTQSGAKVAIFQRLLGRDVWNSLANVTTNEQGQFSCAWTPVALGTFEFKANWTGTQKYEADESDVITVVARSNSSVSLSADRLLVVVGENTTMSGEISPARSGATVTILCKNGEGSWSLFASTVTNQAGQFTFNWKPNATGVYEFKAKWDGDDQYHGNESNVVTISVVEGSLPFDYPLYLGAVAILALAMVLALLYWRTKRRPKK